MDTFTPTKGQSGFRFVASVLILINLWLLPQMLIVLRVTDEVGWPFILMLAAPAYLMGWAFTGKVVGTLAIGSTVLLLSFPLSFMSVPLVGSVFGGGLRSPRTADDDIAALMILFATAWLIWPVLLPSLVLLVGAMVGAFTTPWRFVMQTRTPRQFLLAQAILAVVLLLTWFLSSQSIGLFDDQAQRENRVLQELRQLDPAHESNLPPPEIRKIVDFNPKPSRSALESYLESVYNSETGLYREAPVVAPDTYWVWSDAYLAGADISRWDVPPMRKWTVVRGEIVPEEVFTFGSFVIDLEGGVKSEAEDPTVIFSDWLEYADRLLLAAINARNEKSDAREKELLSLARQMWDGNGLRDKVHLVDGKYETYKTALYYYATDDIPALKVLSSLQETSRTSSRYGGMYTEYGSNGKPFAWTDTNTETTAVTLLALTSVAR